MKTKSRLVIDTNIYVSAMLKLDGNPAKLVAYAGKNAELVFSRETLDEFREVITREKFQPYLSKQTVYDFIGWLELKAKIVYPRKKHSISPDRKDNKFIDVAVEGKADFVISGDKRDLLSLGEAEGIPIISVNDFLEKLFNS